MARERRLGKGLGALLPKGQEAEAVAEVRYLDPDEVEPNRNQPRIEMEPGALSALIESIDRNGILQPIVVREAGKGYELIAGERRWRAAQHLGLERIPAVVKDVSDDRMLELALVENIQREDLNPIEKAKAFSQLIRELKLTQEEAAERVGMDRSSVANFIRLLDLPPEIQTSVSRGTLSMGHARALLSCRTQKAQRELAKRIEKDDLSVREVERLVSGKTKGKAAAKTKAKSRSVKELEETIGKKLGLNVTILSKDNKSGQVMIRYQSLDELDGLLQALGVK